MGLIGIDGVLVKHESEFNLEGVIEVAWVETNELLGLVEAVDEGVAMDVEFLGGFGEVEAASQEGLNGFEELLVAQERRQDLVGQLGLTVLAGVGQRDKHADV